MCVCVSNFDLAEADAPDGGGQTDVGDAVACEPEPTDVPLVKRQADVFEHGRWQIDDDVHLILAAVDEAQRLKPIVARVIACRLSGNRHHANGYEHRDGCVGVDHHRQGVRDVEERPFMILGDFKCPEVVVDDKIHINRVVVIVSHAVSFL